jgi:hypothetical protein
MPIACINWRLGARTLSNNPPPPGAPPAIEAHFSKRLKNKAMCQLLRQARQYTFILVDDKWKNTVKMEVFITCYTPQGDFYSVRERLQRQILYIGRKYAESGLIFEGYDLPIAIDACIPFTEGNDCFNLVAQDPFVLMSFIKENCLNPTPEKLQKILWRAPVSGIPLFKEG